MTLKNADDEAVSYFVTAKLAYWHFCIILSNENIYTNYLLYCRHLIYGKSSTGPRQRNAEVVLTEFESFLAWHDQSASQHSNIQYVVIKIKIIRRRNIQRRSIPLRLL